MKRGKTIQPLDFEQCLKDIVDGKIGSRTASQRNSRKIAALCTQERMAGLNWMEQDYLLDWMGRLAEPAVGRDLLRKVLSNPASLPHDILARFIAAPILQPLLVLRDSRHAMYGLTGPDDLKDSTNPADAIAKRAGEVLRGFQVSVWGVAPGCFHVSINEPRRMFRFNHPETAKLVEEDSVDVLRMVSDVRLEPLPIAYMLHAGGPKCRRLLLRQETYEGSGLSLGSLATYAVMAMFEGAAMKLLGEIEAETPGFLRTVKDAAGHNLLWYLGFRRHIVVHATERQAGTRSWDVNDFRDFLFKAKCDKKECDVFGVAWNDVRRDLAGWRF
jgi:hypothetical protein